DRDFGKVSAAAEVRGVALRDLQEPPDLGIIKAGIVVCRKVLGAEFHGRPLSPEARLHATLDNREPVALLAAPIEHGEACRVCGLIEERRVRRERTEVHGRRRAAAPGLSHASPFGALGARAAYSACPGAQPRDRTPRRTLPRTLPRGNRGARR